MFATSRSRRPIFAPPRRSNTVWRKIVAYTVTTTVIALSTWGGVLIADTLGRQGRTNSSVTRWINRQIDQILAIDPVLAGVLGALFGMVCLALYVRDHN